MKRGILSIVIASLSMIAASSSQSTPALPLYISPSDLSTLTNESPNDWISLHPEIEFLPSVEIDSIMDVASQMATQQFPQRRRLEDAEEEQEEESTTSSSSGKTEDNSQYRVQPFVEGVSDYDAYQQAWRLLGFMIDCNTITTDYSNNQNNNQHSNDNSGTGEGCTRYVLWAAVSHVVKNAVVVRILHSHLFSRSCFVIS